MTKEKYLPKEERFIPDWMQEDFGYLGEDAVQRAYEVRMDLFRDETLGPGDTVGRQGRLVTRRMRELYPEFNGSRVPYVERVRRMCRKVLGKEP